MERGMKPFAATMLGAEEMIGFTVLSMSASLVAVFIPILMFQVSSAALFREFAVTLSVAMSFPCSFLLPPRRCSAPAFCAWTAAGTVLPIAWPKTPSTEWFVSMTASCAWFCATQLAVLLITIGHDFPNRLSLLRYAKGFFPQQRHRPINIGYIQGDQDILFAAMSE
jgi:multidrug efflux pump